MTGLVDYYSQFASCRRHLAPESPVTKNAWDPSIVPVALAGAKRQIRPRARR
jgi:hypothetical protein